jgi:hypothetical protein
MKITVLEESVDFATLDTEKLFSKLKSHELSRKGCPNHDAYLTSKAFVTSTRVSGHVANPTNTTDSSALEFALSSLAATSNEQYESIPDDEIVLLARKFCTLYRFRKERRRSPRGCFKCGNTSHFIADCPKRKKLDASNKYNYNNQNDSSDKGEDKKKYCFGNKNKKKKLQKMMFHACTALNDLDIYSDDSSSSEEDEKPKRKTGDFTGLLDGAGLELRELKACSTLLGACTTFPLLRSDLEATTIEIKDLKHKLDHSSCYTILSPPCEVCVSLKGKLFHATKENTKFQQEVTYLTVRLEKTILSEKMIEEDLSRIKDSATKSTYRLGVGFERCEDKNEKSAPKFIPSFTYRKEEATIKSTKAHYPSNPKPSFNPKREARKENPPR